MTPQPRQFGQAHDSGWVNVVEARKRDSQVEKNDEAVLFLVEARKEDVDFEVEKNDEAVLCLVEARKREVDSFEVEKNDEAVQFQRDEFLVHCDTCVVA